MDSNPIASVEALVDALGGLTPAAEKLVTTPQNVWNWKAAKKLPSQRYLEHKRLLESLGLTVSDELWFGVASAPAAEAAE